MRKHFSPYNLLNYVYLDIATKYEVKNFFLIPSFKKMSLDEKIHDFNSDLKNEQLNLNYLCGILFANNHPSLKYSILKKTKRMPNSLEVKSYKFSITHKKLVDILTLYKTIITERFFLIRGLNFGEAVSERHKNLKELEINLLSNRDVILNYATFFGFKDTTSDIPRTIKAHYRISVILRKNKLSSFLMYNEFKKFFQTYINL